MTRLIALALLATTAGAPAAALAQDAGYYAKNSAATYVGKAASMDTYEQESSKLVMQSAANPDVRRFAQMMISDHAKTSAQVMAAAKAASLGSPANLLPEQAGMLDKLRALPKEHMVRGYIDQQVAAHEQALALHQSFAEYGDNPGLKAAAAGAVPIIRAHLDEARRIQTAMGGPMAHEGH
jgi:putative membrane protein